MKRWTIGAAALVAAVAGAAAYAAIPAASGLISGCYEKHTGLLRVIDAAAGKSCTKYENAIAWSQQGPQGEPGTPGVAGPPGSPGPPGAAGTTFGTGAGLELIDLGPGPFGGNLLQIAQGHRLPQGCAPGQVPQRAGADGWTCGAGAGGGGLPNAYHAAGGYVDLGGHVKIETVAVAVPPGSYVINAVGHLLNSDIFGGQAASCELDTGGATTAYLPEADEDAGDFTTAIPVLGVATLAEPGRIVLRCSTWDGIGKAELTAIKVAGVN